MANELEKAITIKEAIDNIDSGDLLLPSIQRRFVWNTKQVEFLFDSIMQDYPINKGGNNEERNTNGYKDFKAVIDGQQRLNSLYIGLKGTYAYKRYVYRKKKYQKDEQDYPSRKLYLDILNPIVDDEEKKFYDFRFLIHNEHEQQNKRKTKGVVDEEGKRFEVDCFWFEVGEILKFQNEHSVITYLSKMQ